MAKKKKVQAKPKKKIAAKVQKKTKLKSKSKQKVKTQSKSVAKTKRPKVKAKVKSNVPVKKQVRVQAVKKGTPIKKTAIDYSKVINPLGERLLIRVEKTEKVSSSGLIIVPDTVETVLGYSRGTVLAVGTGYKNKKGVVRPFDVQLGDVVLFPDYAKTEVKLGSEVIYIVNESDILGIMSK